MEVASLCNTKPPPTFPTAMAAAVLRPPRWLSMARRRCKARLAAAGPGAEEIVSREEEEEWRRRTGKGKCGERGDVVELLECLEREAIMGDDEGKDPMDYDRRARIFDKSSRVFRALKQLNNDHPTM